MRILYLTLAIIGAYWGYTLWRAVWVRPTVPSDFRTLVMGIAIHKTLIVSAIVLLLWAGSERLRDIGFGWPDTPVPLGYGVASGPLIFILINVGLASVLASILTPSSTRAVGSLTSFFRDPSNLLLWIPIGVIAGGFAEELERVFILTRFEQWLGPTGLYAGLILSSLMFGVAHLYQSRAAAIGSVFSGLAFGLVYLRARSGVEAAASHAVVDILGVIAATLLQQRK